MMFMNKMICFLTPSKIGLILNFIGTIMVAFSFGKNLGEAHQEDEKGNIIYLASFLSPKLFYFGLSLLGIGFFVQLFD